MNVKTEALDLGLLSQPLILTCLIGLPQGKEALTIASGRMFQSRTVRGKKNKGDSHMMVGCGIVVVIIEINGHNIRHKFITLPDYGNVW